MDRLICGDVGYGKTEIAVRAAFKAVQDGKQVAVLVPTTLLVQQHLSTFTERFADSRSSPADVALPERRRGRRRWRAWPRARWTWSSARTGCSRRRPGSRSWADHHRRGAAVRRGAQGGLKHMRTQVDVLAMSATPIPRTLEMGADRHPRDVDDPHPAGGAAPDPHLRRPLRQQADRRRDPARADARRPGLLRAQPRPVDQQGRGPARASSCPRPGSRSRTAR